MNRPFLACVFLAMASAAVCAQQQPAPAADGTQGQYSGQSNPPADDVITAQQDPVEPEAKPEKPRAGKPLVETAPAPGAPAGNGVGPSPAERYAPAPARSEAMPNAADGTDEGIVKAAPADRTQGPEPALSRRYEEDPDGDIVHPHPLGPGELGPGATIRVRLETELSTARSEAGETFRSKVASDVLQDGKVLIPTGAAIEGRVVEVSEGHTGGHGTIRLRPETVILPDGQQFHLDAQVTGTPGSRTTVSGEGTINAGSRWKKDGIEYGGAMGAGAVTGAVIAGPVGALTGTIIGAGAITVHLLTDHPQATLEPGTVLLITLNSRLNLVATNTASN
ncbi:hypothetical protein DYQ86_09145 [Acidobacteria bacterium AB60]|nr:hypothetical protein DYQ86_09145 [Acidobacteria bacterium AB60]